MLCVFEGAKDNRLFNVIKEDPLTLKLGIEFYNRSKVDQIARELLGMVLVTNINKSLTSGIIVETEAYSYREKGCHAYNNLRTQRTEVMFKEGGHAYVYLCYGIHHLFNVVTNREGKAEAVLIRALQPEGGQDEMVRRMKSSSVKKIASGPGKLTKAMGIDRKQNGQPLTGNYVWIENSGIKIAKNQIVAAKRIGIDYAQEDADRLWRFYIAGSPWISRP